VAIDLSEGEVQPARSCTHRETEKSVHIVEHLRASVIIAL
jgi:hypothetical protein